jgi:PilZ domain
MQRRLHPRVRLRLPARLRWSAPLGQRTDPCETVNVSRGGLLLACNQAHGVGHPIWVTIPYDPQAAGAQPETMATVVRCSPANERKPPYWNVAMRFEAVEHVQMRGNGSRAANKDQNGAGNKISLPIRVRPKNVPWHEDAMTLEVSRDKLKFVTNREYAFGQSLLVSFDAGGEAPWSGDGEWETQVTGIEMGAGSESLCITVRKKSP